MKNSNGQILQDVDEVRKRCLEYFEQVMNVEVVKEANINAVAEMRMPVMTKLNIRSISIDEVRKLVNEMKLGKAPGLNDFSVDYVKNDGVIIPC